HVASDGVEALHRVSEEQFDAVLMDIQMPNMDGYEATRKIREMPDRKTLPVIAMTASVLMSDERHCIEAGMNGFVPKPIRQENLFEALVRYLQPEAKTPPPEDAPEPAGPEADDLAARPVPGLNVRNAMENLRIDQAAYKKALALFAETNRHTAEYMRAAAKAGHWDRLYALAHGLKGGGGNIGGDEVRETAEKIIIFCRNAASGQTVAADANHLLAEMDAGLTRLLSSIDMLVPDRDADDSPAAGGVEDAAKIAPLLLDLLNALKKADPLKISEYFEKLKQYADNSLIRQLEHKIREYEYDDASEAVFLAAEQRGLNLNLIREKRHDE
nr:response regulator [Desulfobacteraceae bacterium]